MSDPQSSSETTPSSVIFGVFSDFTASLTALEANVEQIQIILQERKKKLDDVKETMNTIVAGQKTLPTEKYIR